MGLLFSQSYISSPREVYRYVVYARQLRQPSEGYGRPGVDSCTRLLASPARALLQSP